ncbi:MAG: V-type ATP synthase subunit F [Oscillospiraceae bacterium]|nr:V-type ATP synthase subunit F [Oscillospiraceae bacterium]
MPKIAVLGGRETVMGFKALGLDVFPVAGDDDALTVFRKLTKENDNYAIIYVEETYFRGLSAEIDRFKDSPTPAVILIPGREGSLGLGQSALQSAVLRAVGSDIL